MILKYGSRANSRRAVQALQHLLGLSVTGVYDATTRLAVKVYQQRNALTADGIAGEKTLAHLAGTLPCIVFPDYSGSNHVRAVQALVGTAVDGKYGKNTRANVAAFQAAAGITRTGNISSNDWLALWDCPYERTDAAASAVSSVPVDYKQGDPRWGKLPYTITGSKKQTIASSGCGPTSMADIMAAWIDKAITPVEMCDYAIRHGYRSRTGGTAWGIYKAVFNSYASRGFAKFVQTRSMATLKAALADGAFAICSMGPGYWTSAGHFICAYKMDDHYVYARDPASKIRKRQKTGAFEDQRKQFFIFWPRSVG